MFGRIHDGTFVPNALGAIVAEEWATTSALRHATLDAFVVMPNHVHGIVIFETERGAQRIPRVDSHPPLPRTIQPLGRLVASFKAAVTKRARHEINRDGPLWQRNYHEHVIRSERDLATIREYIVHNPAKWADDRYHT